MNYKVQFEGSKLEYTLMTMGWSILIVITLGIAFPAYTVWNFKWFASRIRVKKEDAI